MIIRIYEDGQYLVPDEFESELNAIDTQLLAAVESGDEAGFHAHLGELITAVHEHGEQLADDYIGPSDGILPAADATIAEAHDLIREDGVIRG